MNIQLRIPRKQLLLTDNRPDFAQFGQFVTFKGLEADPNYLYNFPEGVTRSSIRLGSRLREVTGLSSQRWMS